MSLYRTRHSLLQRATNPADQRAWSEFVGSYGRFIYHILHQIGIDPDDIDDLSQQVLIALTRDLSKYDRSKAKFRTWLSTVIRNTAFSHLRKLNRHQLRFTSFGDSEYFDDPGEGPSELDRRIEDEWAAYISGLAMERVREAFHGQAIEVFELSLDGVPTTDIAERTRLSVASVYTLRKRVKKRLYLEIRALTAALEP